MTEEHPPLALEEVCACGARFRIEGGRYQSDWITKQATAWRTTHPCTVRGEA
jgi:hypothetical protein